MRFLSILLTLILFSFSSIAQETTWVEKLTTAIIQEDIKQISTVLNEGKELNMLLTDTRKPFFLAAVQSSPEILEILIKGGLNPDLIDTNGYSAVMRALELGRIDNAKKLKSLGVSLAGITNDGYTVRVLAENVGIEGFGPLYKSKNNFELTEEEANQILLYAAEIGDLESVKFALEKGASEKAKAKNGWTPIMLAGLGGHDDVFQELANNSVKNGILYHESEGVDLITAILVGEGGGNKDKNRVVQYMLTEIMLIEKANSSKALHDKTENYKKIATKLIYPGYILSLIEDLSPYRYKPQPKLESNIPVGIPATNENWKLVQKVLKDAGVYKGAIDGQPGKGTAAALYAYYMPLAKVLRKRSLLASQAAYNRGKSKDWKLEKGQIAVTCQRRKAYTFKDKYYRFCGEFLKVKNEVFEFSGYSRLSWRNADYYYFVTGAKVLKDTKRVLQLEQWYDSKEDEIHTRLRARVLDRNFIIRLFEKSSDYRLFNRGGSKKWHRVKADFKKPIKPDS